MALTQEEIKIKMGIDSSSMQSGLSGAGSLVEKNLQGLTKKFNKFTGDILGGAVMGFFGSLTGSVTQLISTAVDKLSDEMSKAFFDMIYKVEERKTRMVNAIHEASSEAGRLHETVAQKMEDLDSLEAREQFESMTPENRSTASAKILKETADARTKAEAELKSLRQQMKEARELNPQNPQLAGLEFAEKIAKKEKEILELRLKNRQALKDLGQALKDIAPKPTPKPTPIPQEPTKQEQIAAPMLSYKQKTEAAAASWKAHVESVRNFGKKQAVENAKAAANEIQKVSIVEIEE